MRATSACLYTVHCTLPDEATAARWVLWLLDEHLDDVKQAGAQDATLVRLDSETIDYEVRYVFPDRTTYTRYAIEHAPALQAEGMRLFPADLGLVYRRSLGDEILSFAR